MNKSIGMLFILILCLSFQINAQTRVTLIKQGSPFPFEKGIGLDINTWNTYAKKHNELIKAKGLCDSISYAIEDYKLYNQGLVQENETQKIIIENREDQIASCYGQLKNVSESSAQLSIQLGEKNKKIKTKNKKLVLGGLIIVAETTLLFLLL